MEDHGFLARLGHELSKDVGRHLPKVVEINRSLREGALKEFYDEHVFRPCRIATDWTEVKYALDSSETARLVLHHLSERAIWEGGILQDIDVSFASLVAFAGLRVRSLRDDGSVDLGIHEDVDEPVEAIPPSERSALERLLSSTQWRITEKRDLDNLVGGVIDRYLTHRYATTVRHRAWGPIIDLWAREKEFYQILHRQVYALGPPGIKGQQIAGPFQWTRMPFGPGKDQLGVLLNGTVELNLGKVSGRLGPLYLYYDTNRYMYSLLASGSAGYEVERAKQAHGNEFEEYWESFEFYRNVLDPEQHARLLEALGTPGEGVLTREEVGSWQRLLGCRPDQVTSFRLNCDNLMVSRGHEVPPTSALAIAVLAMNGIVGSLAACLLTAVVLAVMRAPVRTWHLWLTALLGLLFGLYMGDAETPYASGLSHVWSHYLGMGGRRVRSRSPESLLNKEGRDRRPTWHGSNWVLRIDRVVNFMKESRKALKEDTPLDSDSTRWDRRLWDPFH